MGRPSHSRTLSLWANGRRVGRWTLPARGDMELQYDPAWVEDVAGRPISLSLPFTPANQPHKGDKVRFYFDNLLPNNDEIRKRVGQRFRTDSTDPFDLLAAIGRDCVGALQLLGENDSPEDSQTVKGKPMSDEDIDKHLSQVTSSPRFGAASANEDDLRISIAGAQEKSALCRWQGQWLLPQGSTPTTHILKLPLGYVGGRKADFTTSVDNEWMCLRLLRAFGLPAAHATIEQFGSKRVLVVERFDRRTAADGRSILRLLQEDFCQVLGVSPDQKYEEHGGPGLEALFAALKQSSRAEADMQTLMTAQVLFWLLRAPDGHAKNFSIELQRQGRFALTPLYDVMSAYPVIGDGPDQWNLREVKLAMALRGKNKHYVMSHVLRRHFNSTARCVGYGEDAEPLIRRLLDLAPKAAAQVHSELPPGFNAQVADTVLTGLLKAATKLSGMPPA
jgi:serine/threonine-protein kinase HipA